LKHTLATLKAALSRSPLRRVEGRLVRWVPHLDLGAKPDWLFASRKARRYNPSGVMCVYFAENPEVAREECREQWLGTPAEHQPVTEFSAQVRLERVLDLTDTATLKAIGLESTWLAGSWRRANGAALTQLLGQAVNESGFCCAIRYQSVAAMKKGVSGANVVIFRKQIAAPDFVKVLGPTKKPLQEWP